MAGLIRRLARNKDETLRILRLPNSELERIYMMVWYSKLWHIPYGLVNLAWETARLAEANVRPGIVRQHLPADRMIALAAVTIALLALLQG